MKGEGSNGQALNAFGIFIILALPLFLSPHLITPFTSLHFTWSGPHCVCDLDEIIYQGAMEKRGYYRRNFLNRHFIIYGQHRDFLVEYYDYAGGALKGMCIRMCMRIFYEYDH